MSRIEKGQNRPSGEVFRYLTRKMEGKIDWIMPMLETDSVQALSIRQDWREKLQETLYSSGNYVCRSKLGI